MRLSAVPQRPRESLLSFRERRRVVDAVWLASLLVVFLAIVAAWWLRLLEIPLARTAWAFFAYGALYLAAAWATDRLGSFTAVVLATRSLNLSAVVFLAISWQLVGGVHNPIYLFAFALPVLTSSVLILRGQALAAAATSVGLVTLLAVAQSSELRWYLTQVGGPLGWLDVEILRTAPFAAEPFRGSYLNPVSLAVMLLLFSAVEVTFAFVASSLAAFLTRAHERLLSSMDALKDVRSLFQAVLRRTPVPSVLLYADTAQVLHASDSFCTRMLVSPEDLAGKTLFDVLQFATPGPVQDLLAKADELPMVAYRVGREERIANLASYSVEHQKVRYACLSLNDVSELFYVQDALDALGEGLVVIGNDRRLLYYNEAARRLLGPLHFGQNTGPVLAKLGVPGWLGRMPGMSAKYGVESQGRRYAVRTLAAAARAYTVVLLTPLGQEPMEGLRAPLKDLYQPALFTKWLTDHLSLPDAGGSLAVLELADGGGHEPLESATQRFLEAVESELGASEILVGLRERQFGVLLPSAEPDQVTQILARVRERLQTPNGGNGGSGAWVFTSGTVAIRAGADLDALMTAATKELRRSKLSGPVEVPV